MHFLAGGDFQNFHQCRQQRLAIEGERKRWKGKSWKIDLIKHQSY
jgi:hypothetical protein